MVDAEAESMYVKLMLRLYDIIAQQKIQIQTMQELLSKGKKETKTNVGKSKLSDSNNRLYYRCNFFHIKKDGVQ